LLIAADVHEVLSLLFYDTALRGVSVWRSCTLAVSQVVLGVLGCPNMPIVPLEDANSGNGTALNIGTDDVGVLFTAQSGCGAHVAPLSGALLTGDPLLRMMQSSARESVAKGESVISLWQCH
jgi:hypothetical protein